MAQLTSAGFLINFSHCKADFQARLKTNTVTSTPKVSKVIKVPTRVAEIDGRKNDVGESETENFLLESRKVLPLAFSNASQTYLNNLHLNLAANMLVQLTEGRHSRGKTSRRSKSRERSLSPGGATKMSDSKWEKTAEIVVLLIDEIIFNFQDLSDKEVYLKGYDKSAKELVVRLIKEENNKQRQFVAKYCDIHAIIQSLEIMLNKLGLILPRSFSEQFLLLRALLEKDGEVTVLRQERINAVQTMLFNTTQQSRVVLRKILTLFNMLYKDKKLALTKSALSKWLRPSLFEGETSKEQLKICHDFITLPELLFKAPRDLVALVSDKARIYTGIILPDSKPEDGKAGAKKESAEMSMGKRMDRSCATKRKPEEQQSVVAVSDKGGDSLITLNSFRKIDSPNKYFKEESVQTAKKRHSFTEITKKICKRALSPLRPMKGRYNIDTFYAQTKKVKSGE